MKTFLAAVGHLVLGVLSGFDRLVFRGHLRQLSYAHGMECYLSANHVLLKDFKAHAMERTEILLKESLAEATRRQRPVIYLNSASRSKEDLARTLAQRDQIRDGLIAVFKCVEPCWTFEVHRNRERRMLELQGKTGKCAFLYHYYLHPTFGLMYARIQTWFPFAMQIGLNGREWLARQLDRAGISYERRGNKFTDVADFAKAQALLDRQLRTPWPKTLEKIASTIHPAHPQLLGQLQVPYYWSVYQSEWATDVLFRTRADAQRLFEQWARHAILTYRSSDVMRFLGRNVPSHGGVDGRFEGECVSTWRRREEGLCVKHWVNGNSIKMYDFDGPDLSHLAGRASPTGGVRFETTINQAEEFKVFRPKEGGQEDDKAWRALRRGVADLHRRAQVSQAANERYAAATVAVEAATPLKDLAEPLCRRVAEPGGSAPRRVRALNPLAADDAALLEAVNDPKYAVNGLRNRSLSAVLYATAPRTQKEARRRSARVSRLLRLLRAHGILQKVPKTHRYLVTPQGRNAVTALLAARNANAASLMTNAA